MERDGFDPTSVLGRHLRPTRPSLVPEIETLEARLLVPLWNALDEIDGGAAEPPYWAFSWPGSQALARYVLDRPEIVAGRRVLDVGAGNGLASVAAARAGAARVTANDVDPRAVAMVREHAARNGVDVEVDTADRLDADPSDLPFDVVLVGDLFYSRGLASRAERFVRALADAGREVRIGEPGRNYALTDEIEVAATYRLAASHELENRDEIEARVLRVPRRSGPPAAGVAWRGPTREHG